MSAPPPPAGPCQLRRAKIGVSGVDSGRDRVRRGAALEKLPDGGGGPLQGGGIIGLRTRRGLRDDRVQVVGLDKNGGRPQS
jgi:hypothetical protein